MVTYQTQEEVTSIQDQGNVVTAKRRVAPAAVPDTPPQQAYQQKRTIFRTYQIVWYIVGLIEFLLGFRVVLRLLGANAQSGFGSLIYSLSYPFAAPFINLFATPRTGAYALEPGTIVGMIVYMIIGFAIVKLMQVVKPTTPEEVDRAVSA